MDRPTRIVETDEFVLRVHVPRPGRVTLRIEFVDGKSVVRSQLPVDTTVNGRKASDADILRWLADTDPDRVDHQKVRLEIIDGLYIPVVRVEFFDVPR